MSTPPPRPRSRPWMVTLDCADSQASATFWSGLLGWAVAHAETDYAMLTGPSHALGSGGWRTTSRQPGRTSTAASSSTSTSRSPISTAAEAAVELGATLPVDQPGETWRVLLDPAGHPFCLTKAENWA